MLDERERTVAGGEAHMAFNSKAFVCPEHLGLLFAGPLANILLTLVLYLFLQCMRSQQSLAVLGTPFEVLHCRIRRTSKR
jgi:membrane-associated protease RseP (regulator of RpoE activity)